MSDYQNKLAQFCEEQIQKISAPSGDMTMDLHQQEAMEVAAIALLCQEKAFSIVHSCGSGKTILEGNLAMASQRAKKEMNVQNDERDIILTTERALIYSIREQLEALGLDIGVWGAGEKVLNRPVVLASIQTLQVNQDKLSKELPSDKVSLIIGDEADLYLTEKRKTIIRGFPDAIKIGLTATPQWPDGRNIEELWGKKLHEMKLKEGILRGINTPPLFTLFEVNLDESRLKINAGDYEKKILEAAMKEAELQKAIPEIYAALVPEKRRKNFPTLVFVPSVNLVQATQEELRKRFGNIVIKSWSGKETSTDELRADIAAFNNGEIDILVLCEMGGRGIDLPRARCLIDGYPTLSSNKLEQRHGRVLRRIREGSGLSQKGVNKPFSLIAQIIPKSSRFRPYLLPDLLDCWPDFQAGRLLGIRNQRANGACLEGDLGAPTQQEIEEIKRNILAKKPKYYVQKIDEVDIYAELKLRDELPQANEEGFFEIEGGEYGTAQAWERELGISAPTIMKRLKGQKGITGKDSRGCIKVFHEESVVRAKCSDLLQELPQANKEGHFEFEGKKYGTAGIWERELGISAPTIMRRLEGEKGITGKDSMGRIQVFYEESVVRAKSSDLLQEHPQANEEGFFELEEKKYGTIGAWGRILVSNKALLKRLKGEKGITGKDPRGHIREEGFFEESVVRAKCSDLLQELPQANEEGFFELEGKKHGTIGAWGRHLGISPQTIRGRLKGEKGITGKDPTGNIREEGFFEESVVRAKCSDRLK